MRCQVSQAPPNAADLGTLEGPDHKDGVPEEAKTPWEMSTQMNSGGGTRTPDTPIMIMARRTDSSGLIRTRRQRMGRYGNLNGRCFPLSPIAFR